MGGPISDKFLREVRCKNCGTLFITKSSNRLSCTPSCKNRAYKKRKTLKLMRDIEEMKEHDMPQEAPAAAAPSRHKFFTLDFRPYELSMK